MHHIGTHPNNVIKFPYRYNASPDLLSWPDDPQPETTVMSDSSSSPPDLEELKDKLYGLSAKKRRKNDGLPRQGTLKRSIFDLYHAIKGAKDKGYTYEDLATMLRDSDSGLRSLTAECLRKYYKDAAKYFEPHAGHADASAPANQAAAPKGIAPRPTLRTVKPEPSDTEQQTDSAPEQGDSSLPPNPPLRRITNPSPTSKADESEFLNLD